jgi:small conductance mechanosensitive channel
MLENINISELINIYIIPWGINIAFALVIFVVGRFVVKGILNIVRKILTRTGTDSILIDFICTISNAILMLFIAIAALDQLGVDTTSLVALIAAAGLAIGLSLQDSLKNFASGIMLIMFRPFKAGDFVEAGGTSGTIENISIFSTTMRTGDNREIIVPNGAIYGDSITNYSARDTRRIDMVFGIGYDDDIRKAKEIMQQILGADERILSEPAPLIAVAELADSSVNFNVRPWVNTGDYWAVLYDVTEKIKLAFDDSGISIPYPQMDVHLNKLE